MRFLVRERGCWLGCQGGSKGGNWWQSVGGNLDRMFFEGNEIEVARCEASLEDQRDAIFKALGVAFEIKAGELVGEIAAQFVD